MPEPKWLEPLEQIGHVAMGFGARLVYLDYLLWHREFVKQWPPGNPVDTAGGAYVPLARVQDLANDFKSYFYGFYIAEIVRWSGITILLWKYYENV